MTAKGNNPSISFEYIKSHDYKVHTVHGGIGGPNPHGELVLNLYFERNPIPKKAVHVFDENGRLNNEPKSVEAKEGVIRDVLFGIALRPENARSLGEWLVRNADEYEKMIKQESENNNK